MSGVTRFKTYGKYIKTISAARSKYNPGEMERISKEIAIGA